MNCAFYSVPPDMKNYLRSKLRGHKVFISTKPFTCCDEIDPNVEILGVFVDCKVDKKILNKLKKLKLIVTMSTGYDHVDCKTAKGKKVAVCNVPTYGENTVAQHALALMLAISRKLFESIKRVKEGNYDYHGLRGFDLKNKTIGIIGTGHIGIHLIDMLQGFDANIIAFDAFPNKELEKTHNFKYVSKNKLLTESDIISLHVPLFDSTLHMINRSAIKKMKPGVVLVNTARGALIEPEALVWGLETGQVSAAGLDVLEEENNITHHEQLLSGKVSPQDEHDTLMDNIIIDHPNTIVTPHNAFNSIEALQRIIDTTIENVKSYLAGEIQNDVSKPRKK